MSSRQTTLKIEQVRQAYITEVDKVLSHEGYKLRKGRESKFIKKMNGGHAELIIFIDSYFPIDYVTYFYFSIYQKDIQHIIKLFNEKYYPGTPDAAAIIFLAGDYVDEMIDKSYRQRKTFKFSIRDEEELSAAVLSLINVLTNYFVDMGERMLTVQGVDEVLNSKTQYWANDFVRFGLIEASLISAYLSRNDKYIEIFNFYRLELMKLVDKGKLYADLLSRLNLLSQFLTNE